jgi:hypothetical protein
MNDLSFGDGSASDSDSDSVTMEAASDAEQSSLAEPTISKRKRKAHNKPKYKAWAKNLLTLAETLDLSQTLPMGLERDWRATVVPKGKR